MKTMNIYEVTHSWGSGAVQNWAILKVAASDPMQAIHNTKRFLKKSGWAHHEITRLNKIMHVDVHYSR